MNTSDTTESGATVVITHRVRAGREADYDHWLNEIGPLCQTSPGHLDWQIIRPIAGLTTTYTVVIRFDTSDLPTTFVSESKLSAIIKGSLLKNPGTYVVTVVNPGAAGGVSRAQYLIVSFRN